MRKLGENLLLYVVGIISVVALAPILERAPRTRGKNLAYHGMYVAACIGAIFLPNSIGTEIFSPGGVIVVGTMYVGCCKRLQKSFSVENVLALLATVLVFVVARARISHQKRIVLSAIIYHICFGFKTARLF